MAEFRCCVCDKPFEVPDDVLFKWRHGKPKYCLADRAVARARSTPFGHAWRELPAKQARKLAALQAKRGRRVRGTGAG